MVKIVGGGTDWTGKLAVLFGAAVVVPSLIALALTLLAVARTVL